MQWTLVANTIWINTHGCDSGMRFPMDVLYISCRLYMMWVTRDKFISHFRTRGHLNLLPVHFIRRVKRAISSHNAHSACGIHYHKMSWYTRAWMVLKGDWVHSFRTGLSMATGYIMSYLPGLAAICLWIQVAREQWQKYAFFLWASQRQMVS